MSSALQEPLDSGAGPGPGVRGASPWLELMSPLVMMTHCPLQCGWRSPVTNLPPTGWLGALGKRPLSWAQHQSLLLAGWTFGHIILGERGHELSRAVARE